MSSKRILICTAQVPFARGGAELLAEGLRDALRARGHLVELVALPYQWHPVERLPESALAWRLLDLSHVNGEPVDLVIATKFPSYMVRHSHKRLWLVHQHRQAYDWYGTPLSDFTNTPAHRQVRDTLLRMDRRALSECEARFTISHNVSARLQRFNGLASTPLYPPSRYAERLWAGAYGDYLLSASRLDQAKRLDLLLEAAAQMQHPMPVRIVGDGPDRPRLMALAQRLGLGQRVQFLGFVSDDDLIELYAKARAVFYAPIDEDYGFATVEAFGAARPVVTTHDAGGVLEFVRDGLNGRVTDPDPHAIAQALGQFASDPNLAAHMGQAGQPMVATITWEHVVTRLLDGV
ncbi:MAG: glycosyltransferase family 4 protein [Oscillochloridaceae bacterium umkhey_bin13]